MKLIPHSVIPISSHVSSFPPSPPPKTPSPSPFPCPPPLDQLHHSGPNVHMISESFSPDAHNPYNCVLKLKCASIRKEILKNRTE